ncbi:MAG: hypothetical protein EOP08_06205 [Proteobacteria bacterium]|nr:MAG: hypothetical protein EOP08_06205 [Pseudomonadota bacterium]
MSARIAAAALALVLSAPAFADCNYPRTLAAIPSGKSASKEQMLAVKKQVDQFRRDAEVFLECTKDDRRHETMQADLEKVSKRFNDEVRAYKAANPST